MREVYVITTGTSLFTSAIWDHPDFQEILTSKKAWNDYQRYFLETANPEGISKPGPLFVPEFRKKHGERIEHFLRDNITESNAAEWKKFVAEYDYSDERYTSRYSAEIATMLKLAHWEKTTLPKLLSDNPVKIVCDASFSKGSTRHVAAHLVKILEKLCQDSPILKIEQKPIPDFSSNKIIELGAAFNAFRDMINHMIIHEYNGYKFHFVVSGGYKAYSIIASEYLSDDADITYLHDNADTVFINKKINGQFTTLIMGVDG